MSMLQNGSDSETVGQASLLAYRATLGWIWKINMGFC